MTKIKTLSFLLVTLMVLGGCTPQVNNVQNTNTITARQGYKIALTEAKNFSSDAFLVDLNTTGVTSEGSSNTWYIFFYSPSKNTNLKVNVVGGRVEKTEIADKKKQDKIADNWVDSPDIAKIAVPKCQETGKIANPDYFINLDPGKDNIPMWNFNCLVGENKTFKVYVNALTGEFIKTGQAGIGW